MFGNNWRKWRKAEWNENVESMFICTCCCPAALSSLVRLFAFKRPFAFYFAVPTHRQNGRHEIDKDNEAHEGHESDRRKGHSQPKGEERRPSYESDASDESEEAMASR